MKIERRPLLLGFLLFCGSPVAFGQDSIAPFLPKEVDLATVLSIAKEKSPRMRVERQSIAQAEAERIAAAAYPNPSVSYGRMRHGGGAATVFEGSRQQDVGIEIPLLIGGQRAARIERTEREIEAARARVQVGLSNLTAEAGASYAALLAAQERVKVFVAAHEEANRLRGIVELREKSGMASRYEVARASVEVGALRSRIEEARADAVDRAGTLAGFLGISGWQPSAVGTLAPLPMDADLIANVDQDVQRTPLAVSAARDEEAAQSAVEVARRERTPVPSLSLGRTWTSDPFGAANVVGVTVELPILDSKRGPIVKAMADAEAANLRKQLVMAEVAANAQRLQSVLRSRLSARGVFEKEASDRVTVLRQMSEDAYQLGRASILELLDAGRARTEIDLTRIELSAAVLEAQIRLLALLGRL